MAATTPRESAFNHQFRGCSSIDTYAVERKLGEGTFGEVHKARSKSTGAVVALKKILMHNEKDGFPVTAIREIKLLKLLSHPNVLTLTEMAVERAKTKERKKAIMYMVTPYMEHDLSGMLTNPDINFTEPQIKCYMKQLLEGLRYLHSSRILHRDMKAANLLISNKGILQIADFGLARGYDEAAPLQPGQPYNEPRRDYTGLVVTRWYRPPELLLGLRRYTPAIDLWGVGCVFGEMYKRVPILQGGSDVAQIEMIFDLVGSPNDQNMPGWNQLPGCEGVKEFATSQPKINQRFRELDAPAASLLTDLLRLNWRKRITAISALNHPYFRSAPKAAEPHELPVFEDSHELDRRKTKGDKGPPPAPAGGDVGQGPQGRDEWGGQGDGRSGREPLYDNRSLPGSRDSRDARPLRRPPPTNIDRYEPPGARAPRRTPGWATGGTDRDRGPNYNDRGEKDTYVPSYERSGGRDDRDRRGPRDRDLDRDPPPRRDYRDRDSGWDNRRDDRRDYRDDRRDRDRDRDRRDRPYEDRSRDYDRRDRYYDDRPRRNPDYDDDRASNRSRRTTRSRSPTRREDTYSRR